VSDLYGSSSFFTPRPPQGGGRLENCLKRETDWEFASIERQVGKCLKRETGWKIDSKGRQIELLPQLRDKINPFVTRHS
jgi:hypothetical protein